jgi:hypothetical protein
MKRISEIIGIVLLIFAIFLLLKLAALSLGG